ncbi:MAG TPA: phosphohistidine phosphatase [Spirochaeta sp.]|nr:phosphohistidine phosphatase [Spirochaeta sp.]
MKYITLIRHAAAVHDSSYRDYDRPLRQKGIDKARLNTERLTSLGFQPDLIISSPAERALQTAEIFISESGCGLAPEDILQLESLYLPSPGDILECIQDIDERFSDVFLFSHNNGLSWAAQELSDDRSILMPTGAAVRIELNIDSWQDTAFGKGRRLDFLP